MPQRHGGYVHKKAMGMFSVPPISSLVSRAATEEPQHATPDAVLGHRIRQISVHPQAKLTVNKPGDVYEQEADSTADHVMKMNAPEEEEEAQKADSAPTVMRAVETKEEQDESITPENPDGEKVQRKSAPLETDMVNRKEHVDLPTSEDVAPVVSSVVGSSGQMLDKETRAFMEPRFGHDFSKVRVHTDAQASASAQAIQAKAYTVGSDIAFRSGAFAPGTSEGKHLLAHELTHVVQQSGGDVQRTVQREADDPGAIGNDNLAGQDVFVPDFTLESEEAGTPDHGKVLHLEGTTAPFFKTSAQWVNKKAVRSSGCTGCAPEECVTVSGTIRASYNVVTTVTLPKVSDFPDLTPCEQGKVKNAIDNILAPHEQQHVRAFHSNYDGVTNRAFNQTVCKGDVQAAMTEFVAAEQSARQAQAQTASDALDPFNFDFDITCDDAGANNANTPADGTALANANTSASTATPNADGIPV